MPTPCSQADSENMKQETEMTHTDQVLGDIKSEVPCQIVEIKQEVDYETSDEMVDMQDLKIEVCKSDDCSTELETVSQTGVYEEDIGNQIKVEISPDTQSCLNNYQVDVKVEHMDNINNDQHLQLVKHDTLSETLSDNTGDVKENWVQLSEHNRNTLTNTGTVTGNFMGILGYNVNILKGTEDKNDLLTVSAGENSSTDEKSYKCDVCDGRFTHANSLKRHTRTHTGEKPYKCDDCGAGFAYLCSLKRHKTIHTGEKPYKCDVCGLELSQRSNLKKHERTHMGMKPHKCEVCGKGFAKTCNLNAHRRTHTGEKPYECDICGIRLSQRSNLEGHKRTHTGEKPCKCDVCGKGFAQTCSLYVHKKIHARKTPYKCDDCGLEFAFASRLKRHKKTHA